MFNQGSVRTLTVQTDEGQNVVVHLGPEWFIENQDRTFADGETVEVTGATVDLEGKPVVMATEIKLANGTLKLRDKSGRPAWTVWHQNAMN
jgi:hypothetical protein